MREWCSRLSCLSRRLPLTRNPRYARIPASPRERGEVKSYTRGMLAGRTSRDCAASLIPALAAPKP
ncbi:hypothetical protein Bdiaspc4_05120 [Bradyrhizobium diazoefficiens]|nr:hypothetical protein Bdiaspc4_05120 [Bradyrhizobium diazoefficiens]